MAFLNQAKVIEHYLDRFSENKLEKSTDIPFHDLTVNKIIPSLVAIILRCYEYHRNYRVLQKEENNANKVFLEQEMLKDPWTMILGVYADQKTLIESWKAMEEINYGCHDLNCFACAEWFSRTRDWGLFDQYYVLKNIRKELEDSYDKTARQKGIEQFERFKAVFNARDNLLSLDNLSLNN
jgi:hypothetical protein